jgi:N-acetylmuramoyl-L-alanine amidase
VQQLINKKHLYSFALVSALSFSAISALEASEVAAQTITEGTVTANTLTVRSGPSINYKATDWIRKGTKVTVLKDHGVFSYVQYGNKKGYVHDGYLKVSTKKISTSNDATGKVGTVTATSLTVRSGATINHTAIDWIRKGTQVNVLKDYGTYLHVQYGNKKGYVHEGYLKLSSEPVFTSPNLKTGTVIATSLTVRSGATANHSAIDWIKKGTKVSILKDHGTYVYIQYGNKKGYVHEGYLKLSEVAKTPVAPTPPSLDVLYQRKVSVNNNDTLNLRKGPSVSQSIIKKLPNGAEVDVYKVTGEWAHVNHDGKEGYVHTYFLKEISKDPVVNTPDEQANFMSHTVKRGDTLWGISVKYKTTVSKLKKMNSLTSNVIHVGQVLKVNESSEAEEVGVLEGKKIVIDPGHGGQFAGARDYLVEEDINLETSLKLRDELQKLGATVLMTREADVSCGPIGIAYADDLKCRPAVAKDNNAHMFISMHANAGTKAATGTEVFWYNSERDQELAQYIVDGITSSTGLKNRGAKYANYNVIRNSGPGIASVLVETGFVTNPYDSAIIGNSAKQTVIAKAIANSIVKFYGK